MRVLFTAILLIIGSFSMVGCSGNTEVKKPESFGAKPDPSMMPGANSGGAQKKRNAGGAGSADTVEGGPVQ